MKFHVCGGLDAPDWILANIVTLSTLPAAKVKLMVEQILQRILEGEFNYDNVMKLTDDSTLGESDVKACIAVLHFFIASSAKFDVEESTLARELQQLGLPKEQSDAVARPYWENKEALQSKFLQQSPQLPAILVGAWQAEIGESKKVIMRLTTSNKDSEKVKEGGNKDLLVTLTAEKFQTLLHELKTARALMDEYT
ncbi:unnamed protein product [Sphagnum jensenii]|uniref:COMM domain-containing protein n=1 Tax=Sphagnum jensenii TaxID=128206 RepID=A0ABP1B8R2_9BRYO